MNPQDLLTDVRSHGQKRWIQTSSPHSGGQLKTHPEDFVVIEQSERHEVNTGHHVHLWVEKSGLNTLDVVEDLENILGVPSKDIGYAGMKDQYAVTRQWVSVPEKANLSQLLKVNETQGAPYWRILDKKPSRQKLRIGQAAGNYFELRIRNVSKSFHQEDAANICKTIITEGVPNFFGEQRFGKDGGNAAAGLSILSQNSKQERLSHKLQKLYLNAAQSAIFNFYLAHRIAQQEQLAPLDGDVIINEFGIQQWLMSHSMQQKQAEILDTITGPLWGNKMRQGRALPGKWETHALQSFEITSQQLLKFARILPGTRRSLIMKPTNLQAMLDESERTLELKFSLPSGCYATVLAAQFMGAG